MMDLFSSEETTIIVSIPENDVSLAEAAVAAGADGVKVHINLGHGASGTQFGTLDEEGATIEEICEVDVPVGIVPGQDLEVVRDVLPSLNDIPVQFVDVKAHHLPASYASLTDLPVIASVSDDYSDEEIAALSDTPVAGIELGIQPQNRSSDPATLRDVASYVRIRHSAEKPVFVPSQLSLTPSDVRTLSGIGVNNFILGSFVTGTTADSIFETISSFTE